jgi:two-component system chemotaxis response regulator CheY
MPTILLVDDSKTMREVFKVYLMGEGHELLDAEDAERGMDLLGRVPVDLLVVDMNLPVRDGPAMIRAIRGSAEPALRGLPVLLITGDRSEDGRARARTAGADLFLQKPLDSERVTAAVRQLLARPR